MGPSEVGDGILPMCYPSAFHDRPAAALTLVIPSLCLVGWFLRRGAVIWCVYPRLAMLGGDASYESRQQNPVSRHC